VEGQDELARRSDEAVARLKTARGRARDRSGVQSAERVASPQMRRRHVVIVNRDPVFLDAARVLLQSGRYNVTSTNLVSHTATLLSGTGADVLLVDLSVEEPQVWALIEDLSWQPQTADAPIIFTASDAALLERAERTPWRSGGQFYFLNPFPINDLADVVEALIGPA
jgi:CheY-like chemotaxis protein